MSIETEWAELEQWEARLLSDQRPEGKRTAELVDRAEELTAYHQALTRFLTRYSEELKLRGFDLHPSSVRLLSLIADGADRHQMVRGLRDYRTRYSYDRYLYPLIELGLVEECAEHVNGRKYVRYRASVRGLLFLGRSA